MPKEPIDFDDDEFMEDAEDDELMVRVTGTSRQRLEDYLERKRLREYFEDDYNFNMDDYSFTIDDQFMDDK